MYFLNQPSVRSVAPLLGAPPITLQKNDDGGRQRRLIAEVGDRSLNRARSQMKPQKLLQVKGEPRTGYGASGLWVPRAHARAVRAIFAIIISSRNSQAIGMPKRETLGESVNMNFFLLHAEILVYLRRPLLAAAIRLQATRSSTWQGCLTKYMFGPAHTIWFQRLPRPHLLVGIAGVVSDARPVEQLSCHTHKYSRPVSSLPCPPYSSQRASVNNIMGSFISVPQRPASPPSSFTASPQPRTFSWEVSEAVSSQSKPQDIPPDQHDLTFSWVDVANIIGKLPPNVNSSIPLLSETEHGSNIFSNGNYNTNGYTHWRRTLAEKLVWTVMPPIDQIPQYHIHASNLQRNRMLTTRATASNRLDLIRRKPVERLVYKAWCKGVIAAHGSITSYMCQQRLGWDPLPVSSATGPVFAVRDPTPFANPSDYRIQRNDWPYGVFGEGITHLIVWLKTRIATDPETGLMISESRALAERFVDQTFVERLKKDDPEAATRVLWFKNWTALQSVRGLEHIHVLVRNVSDKVLAEWLNEDQP